MHDMNWSNLSNLQIGKVGEYFAQMTFFLHRFEVFNTIVDEHGVDFVAKKNGTFYEVQVKAVRGNYTFIKKDKIQLDDKHLVCYLRFYDGLLPEIYVFPATVFKNPKPPFSSKDFINNKSKPEFGISPAQQHTAKLNSYLADKYLPTI